MCAGRGLEPIFQILNDVVFAPHTAVQSERSIDVAGVCVIDRTIGVREMPAMTANEPYVLTTQACIDRKSHGFGCVMPILLLVYLIKIGG
jgi:hypothetical protein